MAKDRVVYICNGCGSESPKWQGKCFECGAFNTFVAQVVATTQASRSAGRTGGIEYAKLVRLSEVKANNNDRVSTQINELDSILNGGFVSGQVVLLGGEPGVGKSTLVLQLASRFNSIYVCGEESEMQVKLRAERLKVPHDSILLFREQEIHRVIENIQQQIVGKVQNDPHLIIVDSIQSVYSEEISSSPGNISQVQYCANVLTTFAKKNNVVMILIGQITKGGYLAGPKQLEHIVDTVLQLEGDRRTDLRLLRVHKNRFGSTDQVGVFRMEEQGYVEASDFLQQIANNRQSDVPGSVLTVVVEGGRPLLLEVQALNAPAQYGNARRVVNGFSISRLHMLLAVLERRAGIKLGNFDIYVNISGGLKVGDPALDLPVALAIASVAKNKPFPKDAVAYGEIGLLGEVKNVHFEKKRSSEAVKLGYHRIISSEFNDRLLGIINQVFSKVGK